MPEALDPLPPDARAKGDRAALIAVDRCTRASDVATVVYASPREPGRRARRAITARTIEVTLRLVPRDPKQRKSASLSQGRLLVGMQDGALRVFYLLH